MRCLFGRLAPEKGVPMLLKAWQNLRHIPLRIRGEGSLEKDVNQFKRSIPWSIPCRFVSERMLRLDERRAVSCLAIRGILRDLRAGCNRSLCCGTPVIALVRARCRNWWQTEIPVCTIEPNNAEDLASEGGMGLEPSERNESDGEAGRREFLSKYTATPNLETLERIYGRAIHGVVPRIHFRGCLRPDQAA